jgi:ACR3 family arsenite efflux pump ArsB
MGRIIEKLRKDSLLMGAILGAVTPLALYGLLKLIVYLFELKTGPIDLVTNQKLLILSIVPNVLLLRYYLLKLKYDLTGRGILGVTFIVAIVFTIIEFLP